MVHSANGAAPALTRDGKRASTARRITAAAQELVLDRGLDGFTMDELAAQVGVSRRTLFNYFPSKDDAVLGGHPDLDERQLGTFAAGGPHGHLVDDLAEVVLAVVREIPETREEVVRGRRLIAENPRLLALAHQRLKESVESCMGFIEQREGPGFDRHRVDLAIALVLVCFHHAMDRYLEDDASDLATLVTESVRHAHALLA